MDDREWMTQELTMSEADIYSLDQFRHEMEHLIAQEEEQTSLLEEAQVLLKKLLPNREFVGAVMEKMVTDDAFLVGKIGTIDRNETAEKVLIFNKK